MEVVLKKAKSGDVLVVVKFSEDSNFNPKDMTWCPKLDELDLLSEARIMVMESERNNRHKRKED